MRSARLVVFALASAACSGAPEKPELCAVGRHSVAVAAADRKIIGEASPYPADPLLAAREDELHRSQHARREMAWQVIARTLAPVALAEPGLPQSAGAAVVPRWQTWYAKDDFERMFKRLYLELGTAGRQARQPFATTALDAIFPWNARAVEELAGWPASRYQAYLAEITDELAVHGVGGIARVGYSPAAARHLLAGYAPTLACANAATEPPAIADGATVAGGPVTITERVTVTTCDWVVYGPYFVAAGETLTATLAGEADADLYVRAGAPPTAAAFDCRSRGEDSNEDCTLPAPGVAYVAVAGYAPESAVTLAVAYVDAEAQAPPACLAGELPLQAALVKADWRRAQFGETLPVFDTSAARLADRIGPADEGDWGFGDGQANPSADEIYALRLSEGSEYRLAALHIMTKELRHWVWITLWWSPDPDTDFGADRPPEIAALGGPWANYKMCVVTANVEQDPDPTGGFADSAPSLAAALAAAHLGAGGPSWCSNPYLETGGNNARTNCIGCHQHGGTALRPSEIIGDADRFPHAGRTRVRNNFPTDYLWAVNAGDLLERVIADEVEYYDAFE